MKIAVLGAGVQGTLYGVRLARAGHAVTLVARGNRAVLLREHGAVIQNALSNRIDVVRLPVIERLTRETIADLCLVTVRREQMDDVMDDLVAAREVSRFVVMVNHANGSEWLYRALGRQRVVLGFPGAAGGISEGVDRYVEVVEQRTSIQASAPDVVTLFRNAGFRVEPIRDMDSWMRRHAIFVTAIAGAMYQVDCNPSRMASNSTLMRTFILAVREGWASLDRRGVAPPPLPLRAIFLWVPFTFSIAYWRRLLRSVRGELYFALHARHAPQEMAALAADVCSLVENDAVPHLRRLYDSIEKAASTRNGGDV